MIDTTGQDVLDFWDKYYQEGRQRELRLQKELELTRDGLGYINPDANNGYNDPIKTM